MKKQKTLKEKKIHEQALKETAKFMAIVLAIEVGILFIMALLFWKISAIAFEVEWLLFGGVLGSFDIALAFAGYVDFKREITKIVRDNNQNKKSQ